MHTSIAVTKLERLFRNGASRRKALASFAAFAAASPVLRAQLDPHGLLAGHRRFLGLDEMETVFDFEPLFNANLPQRVTDYTYHGDGSEFTLRRNREAMDWVEIVPGTPIDPASIDLSTTILGQKLKYPVFISPSSNHSSIHPDGEVATHQGASAANTLMMMSSVGNMPLDKVMPAAPGPVFFQFYPLDNLDSSRVVFERAQAAGCSGIVVTVDQQASTYERDLHDRNLGGRPRLIGGAAPEGRAEPGTPLRRYRLTNGRLWYTWEYLDGIRHFAKVPFIVKGILTAEDAELCVRHGVDAILVSNHGGRSMDYGPSTLEVLPEIVAAVNGRIPVLVDSGFRRGSDVFKALALGANAVGLGRAIRFGLGAFGAAGVQRVLEIVQRELVQTAAAAGRRTLASIDRNAIRVNFV